MLQTNEKLMLRLDGHVTVYGDWAPWRDDDVLAALGGHYSREPIPPVK